MNYYEINRYCSPKSLLVVNPLGKLSRIYCPFPVMCIEQVGTMKEFGIYSVKSVLMTEKGSIVFVIDDVSYHHSQFRICVPY